MCNQVTLKRNFNVPSEAKIACGECDKKLKYRSLKDHVKSAHNPCDTGTRPDKLSLDAVGPASRWQVGAEWMSKDIDDAIAADIIKPALKLRIKPEEEDEFNDGCIFEKPEILTRGHVTVQTRVNKIEERAVHSNYLIPPTKFKFPKLVRIYSNMISFITNCRRNKKTLEHLKTEKRIQFSIFLADSQSFQGGSRSDHISDDESISMALT